MSQEVDVVAGAIVEREGVDLLPEEFGEEVPDPHLLAGIVHYHGQRFDETQAMISFPQEERPCVGCDPIIP